MARARSELLEVAFMSASWEQRTPRDVCPHCASNWSAVCGVPGRLLARWGEPGHKYKKRDVTNRVCKSACQQMPTHGGIAEGLSYRFYGRDPSINGRFTSRFGVCSAYSHLDVLTNEKTEQIWVHDSPLGEIAVILVGGEPNGKYLIKDVCVH